MAKKVSEKEKNTIRRMIKQGASRVEIVSAVNRHPVTISLIAEEMGLPITQKKNFFTPEAREHLIILFHQGLSDGEIAKELGFGRSTIANERHRLELYRPNSGASTEIQSAAAASNYKSLRMKLITEAWV